MMKIKHQKKKKPFHSCPYHANKKNNTQSRQQNDHSDHLDPIQTDDSEKSRVFPKISTPSLSRTKLNKNHKVSTQNDQKQFDLEQYYSLGKRFYNIDIPIQYRRQRKIYPSLQIHLNNWKQNQQKYHRNNKYLHKQSLVDIKYNQYKIQYSYINSQAHQLVNEIYRKEYEDINEQLINIRNIKNRFKIIEKIRNERKILISYLKQSE